MKKSKKIFPDLISKGGLVCLFSLAFLITPISSFSQTRVNNDELLNKIINGPQRTPAYKLRDRYRHPLETLKFFGVQPNMTVIEVLPGSGWYTEILAPFLKKDGHLVEATPPRSSPNPYFRKMAVKYDKKLSGNSDIYGNVTLTPFEPPEYMPLGGEESADMVVSFLNLHDFIYFNVHNETTSVIIRRFFQSAYQVLKPGGVLGIVAHRARSDESLASAAMKGRVPQSYAIREAEQVGFKLSGTSEINANSKDNGIYPVWYLPPTLKLGQQDREKYLAIGESDDMTLRFIKPVN